MSTRWNRAASGTSPVGEPRLRSDTAVRRLEVRPEGLPILALIATGLITFVVLATSSWTIFPILAEYLDAGGGLGPLLLPTMFDSVLAEALAGTAFLLIISVMILMVEQRREFPPWVPYCASFPVAWLLTLPSALEYGGPLSMWIAFGAMVAAVFCMHWQAFTWARTIWG